MVMDAPFAVLWGLGAVYLVVQPPKPDVTFLDEKFEKSSMKIFGALLAT
jgi:hypothetical protein